MYCKICHLTSVHSRYDGRIFLKELKSLKEAGFDTYLIVADGKEDEITKEGIKILDVGIPRNRKERVLKITNEIYKKALKVNADIYHFHDPELIPMGLKLKKWGKRVIYDVHEDVPRQILTKPYLNKVSKKFLSFFFEKYEDWAVKKFDFVITATPYIRDRLLKITLNVVDINNYPLLEEFPEISPWKGRKAEICYIGGIAKIRGIVELIKSLENVDTLLHLAGSFESKSVEEEVRKLSAWRKVRYYGFVDRTKVQEILKSVMVGMVTFLPCPNHVNSQPNKLFEYMAAGLPVVASNFPLWKEIVEENRCGICVNPLNPKEIAEAIKYLLTHPEEAKVMGENGRKAVLEKYNWSLEERKLIKVYKELLND
ncbi:Glycosyltransferase involved in cell wall bisynthesis [Desulfurobacterium pacificum]|uniref:Glycosyltransferase involved in cell wall bisynthesis n=1 Tax=Desulfurobacterium pacificum TaxID=240166 RepID=A0ABY1NN56_9BACT|nr:glycosyltransferase family 4 protein [Desulfurobacterium pacificum]SMP13999.1 Glycosyltransferase involved in cell wall bisynthesis [Desulfurobacterium pacificum]